MNYHVLTADDVGLLESLLDTFGEVFDDVDGYCRKRPDSQYLRSLLAGDNFIAIVAMENAKVVAALPPTSCGNSNRSAAKSTSTIWPCRQPIDAVA